VNGIKTKKLEKNRLVDIKKRGSTTIIKEDSSNVLFDAKNGLKGLWGGLERNFDPSSWYLFKFLILCRCDIVCVYRVIFLR